jgi:hypothetical protein
MGQYSIQAGDPEQPVQQSVVIARIRGFAFRHGPMLINDIVHAVMSLFDLTKVLSDFDSNIALLISSTICVVRLSSLF